MTSGLGAICFACRFRDGDRCDAFPNGIPDQVLFGGFDHRQPFGGEQTIEGEPILFDLEPGNERKLRAYEAVVLGLESAQPDEEERRRRAERFVWREGDIRWIVPPGANRRKTQDQGEATQPRGLAALSKLKSLVRTDFRKGSLVDDLERLKRLLDDGALSAAEFKKAKRKLLD